MSVLCVCMRDVISEYNAEIEGPLALCALIFLSVFYFVSYVFWEFACGVYLAFWDVVFVCVENDVCEDGVCSVYVWWWLNVRESSLGVCSHSPLNSFGYWTLNKYYY